MNLLRIDTSTRGSGSWSRTLADDLEDVMLEKSFGVTIVKRDLVTTDIPHLNQDFISAMFTPEDERTSSIKAILSFSDQLIGELKTADTILLSTPMFNFTAPSRLKAYIDHISRVGETFTMDESGIKGLLINKKLIIVSSTGSEFTEMKQMDFLEPYLKSLFGFLGITDIDYFALEGSSMLPPEILADKKSKIIHSFSSSF